MVIAAARAPTEGSRVAVLARRRDPYAAEPGVKGRVAPGDPGCRAHAKGLHDPAYCRRRCFTESLLEQSLDHTNMGVFAEVVAAQSRPYLQHMDGGGSEYCRRTRDRVWRCLRGSGARAASTAFGPSDECSEQALTPCWALDHVPWSTHSAALSSQSHSKVHDAAPSEPMPYAGTFPHCLPYAAAAHRGQTRSIEDPLDGVREISLAVRIVRLVHPHSGPENRAAPRDGRPCAPLPIAQMSR